MIKINRLTNANVYIDNGNFLGQIEEITLPQVKVLMVDHPALGLFGKGEYPAGFDKIEASMKWASFYPEGVLKYADVMKVHSFQIRGNVETYQAGDKIAEIAVIIHLRAMFKEFPLGKFKKNDNTEFSTTLTCFSFKVIYAGVELVEYDLEANIYKVGGIDKLAQYRANLGII